MPGMLFQNSSSGWLALLGVAVPVAIHLWNRRPGRTVQVGSVRWLRAAANRRLRSLKLEQLVLLLLRAALVVLLALGVAGPVWQQVAPPRRGQVLLSPAVLRSASLVAVRAEVDSLRRRGYELRELGPGLRPLAAAEWRRLDSLARYSPGLPPAPATTPPDNLWTRVAQAADSLPGRPLRVLLPASQRGFVGSRPRWPRNVTWQLVPVADSGTWLAAAGRRADSLRVLVGYGREEATRFRLVSLPAPRQTPATLTVPGLGAVRYEQTTLGKARLRPAADTVGCEVTTKPAQLYVYHDADHALDARYLTAALRAAGLGLVVPPTLTTAAVPPAPNRELTWLFWLSSAPVPPSWQQRVGQGLQLWQDAPAAGQPTNATLATTRTAAPIRLLRRDTLRAPAGTVRWADGQNQPVLTSRTQGRGTIYHLHTRLHPTWSELADSPELPALLLPLLRPAPAVSHDYRVLAARQVQEATPAAANLPLPAPAPDRPPTTDVRPWLVLVVGSLFALERWLARRAATTAATV